MAPESETPGAMNARRFEMHSGRNAEQIPQPFKLRRPAYQIPPRLSPFGLRLHPDTSAGVTGWGVCVVRVTRRQSPQRGCAIGRAWRGAASVAVDSLPKSCGRDQQGQG